MSSFNEPMVVSPCYDGVFWKLIRPFAYDVGELGGTDSIIVPSGFLTDFGSVPQCLWWLVSPIGKATGAFVLHDYLYATGSRSRLVSDAILTEAMEVLHVGLFTRHAVWLGVRLGGWMAWNEHKKRREAAKAEKNCSPK